ncbi:MAG: APC family permease [Verrucomicrobia bacterium]|nr:APC family permease [Verrucomicrobiota bacterium]
MSETQETRDKVKWLPATALVVASMVGTGVFTSLGFQVGAVPSGPALMLLWLLGGLIALCGALSYAELAAAIPRSGGEYRFLGVLFHPSLGWAAGVLSLVIGFAAPAALAALALGGYAHKVADWLPQRGVAAAALLLALAAHLRSVRISARFQTVTTVLKLALIVGFIGAALVLPGKGDVRWTPEFSTDWKLVTQPAFAVSLLFVFYAYSGWNAAVYIAEEVERPRRTVAMALLAGTGMVTALYLLVNAAFLKAAPLKEMAGVLEVGHVAAGAVLGTRGATVFSGMLSIGLMASVSALVWAGPRVMAAVGRDLPVLGGLARLNAGGVPVRATLLVSGLALGFVAVGDFGNILTYTQSGLTLCSTLTVAGVFRARKLGLAPEGAFRCPWYPLPPLVFVTLSLVALAWSFAVSPKPTSAGFCTCLAAWLLYFPLVMIRSRP